MSEYENVLTVSLTPYLFSLENALRSFACLTREDLIEFKYNDKVCTTIDHNNITSGIQIEASYTCIYS